MSSQFRTPLIISALLLLLLPKNSSVEAQSLPIALDGQYEDWTNEAVEFEDAVGDAPGLDLLRISVANDDKFLFIRLELDDEVVLTDDNDLKLFIDGDKNNLTGLSINGIGAELELRLGDREGVFYIGNSSWFLDLEDVAFHNLPNFSSTVFEIAIGRDVLPDGQNPLFTGNEIRLLLRNGSTGDWMPNQGLTFSYQFDNSPTPPFQPIDLQKLSPSHLRILTWNTLSDGLLDNDRKPLFQRVISVLQPDIVTFNECWDMTAGQAATFMNQALPLGNFQTWHGVKLDAGNITVSRYPILQNWEFFPGHRLTASLIDLPDAIFEKNMLVINGHLRCCNANSERQLEADAFAKFILDAKTAGGTIDLPEGTPFVLSGDMNLVGDGQQHSTLVTGNIVNANIFGTGAPLDWDGTDLLDLVALQADQPFAYTWKQPGSQYPPSRLDYHICSNSVLDIEKAFTLQTQIMSSARLDTYGLQAYDTEGASDHLPKVTDFSLKAATASYTHQQPVVNISITPNPATQFAEIAWTNPAAGEVYFSIKSMDGKLLKHWTVWHPAGSVTERVELNSLPQGNYVLEMVLPNFKVSRMFVKLD